MSRQITDAERDRIISTTFAVCPYCGDHYYWDADQYEFVCTCHVLAPVDIYLEWDERWGIMHGQLVSYTLDTDEDED